MISRSARSLPARSPGTGIDSRRTDDAHRGDFMIGEKLGSFRIDAVLGSGAMGKVYRGTNEATGKSAAVKVISTEIAKQGKIYERFRREAEILQQFRHPNIVRFL